MPATAALGGSTTRRASSAVRAAAYSAVSVLAMLASVSPGGAGSGTAVRATSAAVTTPVPSPLRTMSKPPVLPAALKAAHAVTMSLPVLLLASRMVSKPAATVKVAGRVLAPKVMATPGPLPGAPV